MTTPVMGDEVTIIVKGKVASDASVYDACHKVEDKHGRYHYFYLPAADSTASGVTVTVTKKNEGFISGKPYQDADGDVFIRTSDGWTDRYGSRQSDAYPSRPMRLMEPASTVTENALKTELQKVFYSGDYMGRITSAAVPRLVTAVKNAGVKVTAK